jgi:hypothetical protein
VARGSRKQYWADLVAAAIPVDEWMSQAEVCEATKLTPAQVMAGVAWIRDEVPDLPLVSSRDGYSFTLQATAIRKYNNRRVRAAFTIIRRLYTGVIKPWLVKINHPKGKEVDKQFSRLLEDLADVLR